MDSSAIFFLYPLFFPTNCSGFALMGYLDKKKRKLIGFVGVYYFFLSINIPTIAIAIMIAIVAPMM